jgi:hypothetical protein
MKNPVEALGFARSILGGEAMQYRCGKCHIRLYRINMIEHLKKKHGMCDLEAKKTVQKAYFRYKETR